GNIESSHCVIPREMCESNTRRKTTLRAGPPPFSATKKGSQGAVAQSIVVSMVFMAFILTSSRMVDARDFDGPRLSRRARGKPAQRLARQIDRPGDTEQVARTGVGQRGGQRLRRMIDRANIE